MSTRIKIGHASISEHGSINGAAGDTGNKEVYIKPDFNILSKNYNVVLRPKSKTLAEKSVAACIAGCNNDNIGYSQNTRNTLYNLAKNADFDLSKVGLCNTDCSAFMTVCAIAGGAKIEYGSNAPTTSNMRTRFQQSGYYSVLTASKYTTKTDNLKSGDILVCEGHHTVMVLENGSAIIDEEEEVVEPVIPEVPEEPDEPTPPIGVTTAVKITTYSIDALIDKIENTKASINIRVMEQKTGSAIKVMSDSKVAKYTWKYQLTNLSNNKKTTKELSISSGTYNLNLSKLNKKTAYTLQIFAAKSGAPAFCSQKILFTTATPEVGQTLETKKFTGDTNIIKQAYLRVGNSYKPVIIYKM